MLDHTIERVNNPQKAKHIWIPIDKVSCRTINDYVRPAMLEMNEHVYTHIPIMRGGVVVRVFSENTLLSYLIDDEIVSIDNETKFSDIANYLPLDQHRAESFRFVGQEMLVPEIEDIFADAVKKSDRIGLIFVTNSGRQREKLLGIISAWDVAGID